MPAVIESTLYVTPGGAVVPGSTQQNSRDDLRAGYQVVLHSVQTATTYSWDLSFAADSPGSAVPGTPFDGTQSISALLPPLGSTRQDANFNVDFEGSYLIRLVVDAGLPTEDTQFIRCRLLTLFGELKLVAAGERRDQLGVIPVDATPEGWSNDQNANLQRISLLLRRLSTSGRVLYVDANRGRDSSAAQNDYDNVISIPGPDPARPVETGIKVRAMAHGDFATINEAIAYALAAAARGEPAPSKVDPYFIHIRPGFYTEDLNLASFIHLVGDMGASSGAVANLWPNGPQQKAVIVRTVNAGGTGTHRYNPGGTAAVQECFLHNLHLENTANTTSPVVDQLGGLLILSQCVVQQKGDDAAQGEAVRCSVANILHAPQLWVLNSHIQTLAATGTCVALTVDAIESATVIQGSVIQANSARALVVNATLYENCPIEIRGNSVLAATGVAYSGYASRQTFEHSQVHTWGAPGTHAIHVAGAGAKAGNVELILRHTHVEGAISFATANAMGTTSYIASGLTQAGVAGPIGVLLPDAPGDAPTTDVPELRSDTLWYIQGYEDPRAPGAATIPGANQVAVEDVQRILDTLWRATFPTTGTPFQSLTGAYNGYSLLDPLTAGVGLGRNINAVGGAVQIQGAVYPTGLESHLKHGGVQIEGVLDLGGFINGVGADTLFDVGGSEIHLNPDQAGSGPFIGLGRATWPSGVTQPDRGFAAGFIVAGGAQAPAGNSAYHLHLRTKDLLAPALAKTGNLYVVAGATSGGAKGGEVHIVGGSHRAPGGTVGNLWLVPGNTDTPSTGVIWLVGAPAVASGALRAKLTPVNAFVAGTAGTVYFATPTGVNRIVLTGAEANAAAVTASINAQCSHLFAADAGGKVILYSEYGPAGDILYLGGTAALNTAMGDYTLGAGAVFTPGAYGDKVSVDVPQNGRLQVNGDLEVTGAIMGGGTLGAYQKVLLGDSPYTPAAGEGILDLVPAGGVIILNLPAAAPAGTLLTIRVQGTGSVTVTPVGADTVLGQALYYLFAGQGLSLFKDDSTDWKGWVSYTGPGIAATATTAASAFGLTAQMNLTVLGVQLQAGIDTVVTLDTALAAGREITIGDELGLANVLPSPGGQKISIIDSGGALFDGASSLDITTAYGSRRLCKMTSGHWKIL